jgi:hypothetical protein
VLALVGEHEGVDLTLGVGRGERPQPSNCRLGIEEADFEGAVRCIV